MNRRILIIENNKDLLDDLKELLGQDFDISTASGPEEGLAIVSNEPEFAVFLSDYQLPGMTGARFLEKASEISPDTVRMIITGMRDFHAMVELINKSDIFRFLPKPVSTEMLFTTLEAGLRQYSLVTAEKRLKSTVEQANMRMRTILSNTPVILYSVDKDGTVRLAEGDAIGLLGVKPGELEGWNVFEFTGNDEKASNLIKKALSGEKFNSEVFFRDHYFDAHFSPIHDKDGNVEGTIGSAYDITKRKKAEKAIKESEENYRRIFELSPEMIVVINSNMEIENVNKRIFDFIGYRPDEIIGMKLSEVPFIKKGQADLVVKNFRERISGKEVHPYELEFRGKKGGIKTGLIRANIIKGYAGETKDLVMISDITDRKQAENRLREAFAKIDSRNKELSELNENYITEIKERKRTEEELLISQDYLKKAERVANIGYWQWDVKKDTFQLSGQFKRILGLTDDNAITGFNSLLKYIHPDQKEKFLEELDILMETGKVINREYKIIPENRDEATVHLLGEVTRDRNGEAKYMFGTLQDITERRKSQETLRLRERALSSTSNGIVISDARKEDMPVIYVNPAFSRITGYSEDDIIGRNCRILHRNDKDQPPLDMIRTAIRHKSGTTQILRNYKKDGTLFWNELSISPIFDENGELSHYVGIQNDITDRIESERMVMESNRKLHDAYETIKTDLSAAADLQKNLLPQEGSIDGIDFKWMFIPSVFISGDIFNYFRIDDRFIAFYLIDVSGHGIPSALLSVTLSRVLTREYLIKKENKNGKEIELYSPAEIAKRLNKRFHKEGDEHEYFTMFIGYIDLSDNLIKYCTAGHPSPFILRESGEIEEIGTGGFPVGLLDESTYEDNDVEFNKNDRMILYSDGITECTDEEGNYFMQKRFINILEENFGKSGNDIMENVHSRLQEWRDGNEFEDDVTMLILNNIGKK